MKHKHFIIILFLIFFGTSCDKIKDALDELTKFEMEYNKSITISSTVNINIPFDIITPEIESNSESTFESNNTHKDLIEEIKLIELNLELTSPEENDFGFIKSLEIYITAEGLEETKIAWIEDIPEDIGKTISLNTEETNLKEYIKKDRFSLKTTVITDKVITEDHEIDIQSTFFVDAKILGI